MNIEIYADVVCPWCYIGERRFFRALAENGIEAKVTFKPYQLQPDAPRVARPLREYLQSRFGANAGRVMAQVADAAAGEGIPINWDSALAVNTFDAHRLLRLALQEYGADVQHELMNHLFAAHFTEGLDNGSHDQLVELAELSGMDATRARTYIESDEGVKELETELRESRDLGIRAVPTFVFDRESAIEGAQSADAFGRVLKMRMR